jgi:YesN/AraC family two-component response regulator
MTAMILVVDDEPDLEPLVLQKFRRQIRDGAVSFIFARDGVEALDVIAANPDIEMVVTDINMPRMDGLSLLAKLQDAEERLSTIIVSAYGDMANIRTAMNRGAFDFLMKPIDFADLETTISKTLKHLPSCAKRGGSRWRPSARTPRCRATSRLTSPSGLPATLASLPGSDARWRRCSLTSPVSRRWRKRSTRRCLASY